MAEPRTFTCASCGNTYDSGWTQDEAMAESREMFGDHPKQDLAVVCDDCFQGMEAQRKAAGVSLESFREPANPAALDAAYKAWVDHAEAEFNALPEDVRQRINEAHEAVMAQMFPVYAASDFDC